MIELPASPPARGPSFSRPLRSLRISVTDRCNMRCRYCMPEAEYVWLPRASILSFEEIDRLAGIFAGLGVHQGAAHRRRAAAPTRSAQAGRAAAPRTPALDDLALTTNGILLARQAAALRAAGLRTGDGEPRHAAARADAGVRPQRAACRRARRNRRRARRRDSVVKLNTVVIRGYNDDEMVDLLEFARGAGRRGRASSSTWTWAARPAGRMDQVVSQAGDPGHGGAALRAGRAAARGRAGRRPSGSPCPTGPRSA